MLSPVIVGNAVDVKTVVAAVGAIKHGKLPLGVAIGDSTRHHCRHPMAVKLLGAKNFEL